MKAFFSRMNPTVRGFLIILAIVGIVVVLQLEATLTALFILARIAFVLAIAYFVFLMWREHRWDISQWPGRRRGVFYGAAALVVVDFVAYFVRSPRGPDALVFFLVLAGCGYAMWRVWRDQHTFS